LSFRARILKAEIEALRIALGAQASKKHSELSIIPLLGSDMAFPYLFLEKLPSLLLEDDPIKFVQKIIKLIGECETNNEYNEVSRLSMIVGDTRKVYDVYKPKVNQ